MTYQRHVYPAIGIIGLEQSCNSQLEKERSDTVLSSESLEQTAVVNYCDFRNIPVFHIPNGGSRNKKEAKNLKKQGVKAGVPDLCIPIARHGFHGLYIEMKYGTNKLTEKQAEWLELLNDNGYKAVVCYGYDEAKQIIDWYTEGEQRRSGDES